MQDSGGCDCSGAIVVVDLASNGKQTQMYLMRKVPHVKRNDPTSKTRICVDSTVFRESLKRNKIAGKAALAALRSHIPHWNEVE